MSQPAKGLSYADDSGVVMEWDAARGAYFPRVRSSGGDVKRDRG